MILDSRLWLSGVSAAISGATSGGCVEPSHLDRYRQKGALLPDGDRTVILESRQWRECCQGARIEADRSVHRFRW